MTKSFPLKEEHHQFQTTISQHIAKDYQIRTTRVWEFCKSVEIMKDGNKQANEQDLLRGIDVEEEIEIDILKSEKTLTIPTWSGYNSLLQSVEGTTLLTHIFYFPLIPAPASDFSDIYTAMENVKFVTEFSNGSGDKTVITLDLDLYERAMQIVQSGGIMKGKIILRLGYLHIAYW